MTKLTTAHLFALTTLIPIALGLGGCTGQQKLFGKPSSSTAWQTAYEDKEKTGSNEVAATEAAPASNTQYYLQLAAYTSQENAEKQLKKIKSTLKLPAVVFEEPDNNTQYYKLQVGPFATLQEAVRAEPEVRSTGFEKVRYIRR